jgi:hypothetical protein
MTKLFLEGFFIVLLVISSQITIAQSNYEPLHGVTGYDYNINGELELTFTHSIDFKNGNKQEATYRIKSPVVLSFNLNDLKFFKANPKEFIGYVENPVIASCGYPCGGGLIDIPQGGYREEESWMWVDEHVKWWEDGELTEIKARGEIYPVLQGYFSIPDYPEKYKAGLDQLQFRVIIAGASDSKFHPTRNVVVEYFDSPTKRNAIDSNPFNAETMKKLELTDPALAADMREVAGLLQGFTPDLSVNVGCGSFYGPDLVSALMANNLLEASKTQKEAFECPFEQAYFKDLPRINAMKLINFLIKPVGDYETPLVGSFSSDSKNGSEKATYQGVLKLYGNTVQKED